MTIERRVLKDGSVRYRVRVEGARNPDGSRNEPSRTFRLKKEAEAHEREMKDASSRGALAGPSRQTYADYLAEWLDRKELSRRANTVHEYRGLCRIHIVPAFGALPLRDLTPQALQRFLDDKARRGRVDGSGGLSPSRLGHLRTILHESLEDAVTLRLLPANPATKLTVAEAGGKLRPVAAMWNEAQARTFLAHAKRHPYYAAFLLAMTAGLRRSELVALHWREVDLGRGTLKVREGRIKVGSTPDSGPPKSGASGRTIAVGPGMVYALQAHKDRQDDYKRYTHLVWEEHGIVFPNEYGNYLYPDSLSHMWVKLIAQAGVPRIRLHDARKVAATLAQARGVGLRTMSHRLGHADPRTTMAVYTYSPEGADREAAEAIESALLEDE